MSDAAGAAPKPEGGDDKGDATTITIRVRDQVCVCLCVPQSLKEMVSVILPLVYHPTTSRCWCAYLPQPSNSLRYILDYKSRFVCNMENGRGRIVTLCLLSVEKKGFQKGPQ